MRTIDLFDLEWDTTPQPGRFAADWRRHARWLRSHQWPARVVIVLMEITVAYIAFVLGIVVGAGLFG